MCSYAVTTSGYITSCNKIFKLHYDKYGMSTTPGKIFIKKGYPVQYAFLHICNDCVKTPPGYLCYEYFSKSFKNDCLQFAEGLTLHDPNYRGKTCILRDKHTQLVFGDSDRQNMKIAQLAQSDKNERVNPNIGESYAFVLKNIKKVGEAPYHIAYVLFKDGNTNITLEANAGDKLATTPKFDMYDIRIRSGSTFHDQTKDAYKRGYNTDKIPIDLEDYVTVLLEKI